MGLLIRLCFRMMKLVALVFCLASLTQAAPEPRIACEECMAEMHVLGRIVKMSAAEIEEYLKANYCPTLDEEHQGMCEQNLADNYVSMLQMIVNHFFVDGAGHICLAWGVCQPRQLSAVATSGSGADERRLPFTCPECLEGMELVGAYMGDPLWISEYTVYLEQNFCVGHNDHHCIDMVQRHFPPMHQMTMEKFFVPQEICDIYYPACGGTKPPM